MVISFKSCTFAAEFKNRRKMDNSFKVQKRVAEQVKSARERRNMSVLELAKAVNTSPDVIRKVEDGSLPFNIDLCLHIAWALETEIVYP